MADDGAALASRTGLDIGVAARLLAYAELIRKWNRGQNLTSLRRLDQIVARHLVDVLPLVRAIPAGAAHVADIGSGAGSPGIPVAVCLPQVEVTLVESRKKRAVFLRQCRIELGLGNVAVHHGRAESWAPDEPPDVLVSRAAAPLDRLARMTAHLVGPRTTMLVLKGNDPREELGRLGDGEALAVDRVEAVESAQSHYMVRLAAA